MAQRVGRMVAGAAVLALVAAADVPAGARRLSAATVSYTIEWVPASAPSIPLGSVSLASFEDPTNPTEGPQPTFPHPNVSTPDGPAIAVGQPVLIAPETSQLGEELSGTASVPGGIVVTVTVDGVPQPPITVPDVASFDLSWRATVADVYAAAGSVPVDAPVLAGHSVLGATTNDVTPTGSLAPGTFGSICGSAAVSASDAIFTRLTPALAQSAAGKLSPLVSTPTSQDAGTCAIQFAAPSGLSGGSTWTVDVELAAALTATATATLKTVHLSVDGAQVTIPGGVYPDVTPELPAWVLGPATPLVEQVATVEALPTGAVIFGGG